VELVILMTVFALAQSRSKKGKKKDNRLIPNLRPGDKIINVTYNLSNGTNVTNITIIPRVPTVENPARLAIQFQANLINMEIRCNITSELTKDIKELALAYKTERDELIKQDRKKQGFKKVKKVNCTGNGTNGTNGTNCTNSTGKANKTRRRHRRVFMEEAFDLSEQINNENIYSTSFIERRAHSKSKSKTKDDAAALNELPFANVDTGAAATTDTPGVCNSNRTYVMSNQYLKKIQGIAEEKFKDFPEKLEKLLEADCPHIIRERGLTHLMHMQDMRNQTVNLTHVFMNTYCDNVNTDY
jgi:preprotein translocase subunit YajC